MMGLLNLISILLLLALMSFVSPEIGDSNSKNEFFQNIAYSGAWRLLPDKEINDQVSAVKIMSDDYFMVAFYDLPSKKFVKSYGGTYSVNGGRYIENIEFHTADSSQVGKSVSYTTKSTKKQLNLINSYTKKQENWEKIDEPLIDKSPLAGNWRITEREQNGTLAPMQRGSRKTLKILSGSRFQWAAINPSTKQFSGTGGGTYIATNGKYTETIEFFSRDSSRVGKLLTFDFEVKDNKWHHKGVSSTGNKIYEVWTKE